ncbi:MAG: HAD-IC family P-type ATPase [Pyrinomonadaceae bacterium]|nr:HAD-IC family P-type ATPase [Sphingobacteriaceae bacterium]
MSIKYPIENVHALSLPQTLEAFKSDTALGISQEEANKRSEQFGPNIYQAQKQKSLGEIFIHQFKSLIVYILLVGALVSFYFNDIIDALAILVVVLVNALIGFFMELQARSSMNALREMDVIHSKVLRDGKVSEIPSEKLTPGDVIMLEAGDIIPGDGRLLEANQLQCDESSLTGESIPSEKNTEDLDVDTVLGDRLNMVFKGASVINGKGKAIITGIAGQTELGTISSLVESSEETTTPLDKKLTSLSRKLIWLTLILISIFALTGFLQGKEWLVIVKTSIALAVAAFPEGLPIVATVALAYGMLLMGRKNAIVKKLSSVETLGSTSVILTDKTGTLTENKIYVEVLAFPEEQLKVSIKDNKLEFKDGQTVRSAKNFEKIILIGALCNNASIKLNDPSNKLMGDPIEIALVHFAYG